METKIEKGQFRWNLLVFMFSACTALIYLIILLHADNAIFDVILQPLVDAVKAITEENSGLNTYAGLIVPTVFVSTLAATPVCVCVLLQKNWPLKVKLKAILIIIIYFEVVGQCIPVPFPQIILVMHFTVPGPIVSGLLIYALILNKYHKKYDEIEYKVISKQENILLQTAYICLGIATICVYAIPNEILYIPGSTFNPLSIVISLCISLPIQIVVLLQKGRTLFAKFINIILTDIVFLCIGFIVNVLYNMTIYGWGGIPFAPLAGCVLLRYVFINSSLDAVEDKEL